MNPWDLKNTLNVRKFAIGTNNFSDIFPVFCIIISCSLCGISFRKKNSDSSTAQGKFKGPTVQHAFITHENMQPREVKRLKQDQTAVSE